MKNIKSIIKILKTLTNEHRLNIIQLLHTSKKDMCVGEISETIGISQSLTSHQLRHLEEVDLIEGERIGQTVCYRFKKNEVSKKVIKIIQLLVS